MTNQGDFAANDILTAADLNGFSQVTVVRQIGLSVPNATNTTPAFDVEDIDVGGWHTGTNGYLTVDLDGIFLLTASARVLSGATRGILRIRKNGATQADIDVTGGQQLACSTCVAASSGDQFDILIYQTSGGTVSSNVRLTCQLVRAT